MILLHIYNLGGGATRDNYEKVYDFHLFFRRAMRAVLGACIIFIILMIPKAVVYFFAIYQDPGNENFSRNGYTKILDVLASTLQYFILLTYLCKLLH